MAPVNRPIARQPISQADQRVVRRFIPIHHHAVEGSIRRLLQRPLQPGAVDRRIGGHKGEHRRHLRLDHPRPLAHPAQRHHLAINLADRARALGLRIGGHNRPARRLVRLRPARQHAGSLLHPRHHALNRQQRSNHPRARNQNLLRRNPQHLRRRRSHRTRILEPLLARARIRAAGIHRHRTHRPPQRQALAIDHHRRRRHQIRRKDPCPHARRLRNHQRHIPAIGILHPSLHACRAKALRRSNSA